MPWNLLILPLIAGYLLFTNSYFFKFRQQRLDSQRLVFSSIALGILLLVASYLLRIIAQVIFPELPQLFYTHSPLKLPYVAVTAATILLALLGWCFNYFLDREKFIRLAIIEVGNELELLLASSYSNQVLLHFTLNNDKFYIGWVKELPIPSVSDYIRLIPAFSGYRTKEEKTLVFTTQYLSVYSGYIEEGRVRHIEELDTDLILRLNNIVSVSYFDIEMYERFNKLKTSADEPR